MGDLDEAIREHLELKRRRGADPAEVAQQEQEALAPVTRSHPIVVAPPREGELRLVREDGPVAGGEDPVHDDDELPDDATQEFHVRFDEDGGDDWLADVGRG